MNAIFKLNYTSKLFIIFKTAYSCCFNLRENPVIRDFLQKKFYNINYWRRRLSCSGHQYSGAITSHPSCSLFKAQRRCWRLHYSLQRSTFKMQEARHRDYDYDDEDEQWHSCLHPKHQVGEWIKLLSHVSPPFVKLKFYPYNRLCLSFLENIDNVLWREARYGTF